MAFQHDNVVVCGVDGSAASDNALIWAAHEAKTRNAVLDIVCCHQVPSYPGQRGEGGLSEDAARQIIEAARAKVAGTGVDVQTSLESDDPRSVLLGRSKKVLSLIHI